MTFPRIQKIAYHDPLIYFAHFAEQSGAVFLDSAECREHCGRYSFIGVSPFTTLLSKNGMTTQGGLMSPLNPFELLDEALTQFPLAFHPGLPPFQGGAMGFFSYDLYQHLEDIPAHALDDMQFPDMAIGFYDLVMAFDNKAHSAWIFSSGYPVQEKSQREERASLRLAWLMKELQKNPVISNISSASCEAVMPASVVMTMSQQSTTNNHIKTNHCLQNISQPEAEISTAKVPDSLIEANFTPTSYQAAVEKVIHYILEGDIFEANISQRFKTQLPENLSAFDLYRRLRLLNPAPFAAFLNFGETVLASASPERFLKLYQRQVESRPIKGTRPRGQSDALDKTLADELLKSTKDHTENVMIVDLLRNDLSRVCEDHSVKVPQLCGLESYATVHHLVSVVTGQLRKGKSVVDLLRATFPGGSITGAPKIRAMEIIAEIEPVSRGPYCGSIGYIGFNGDMDSSITIRTYAIQNNIVTFQAGGAVVVDSDPLAEYEETLTKANALRKALTDDFIHDSCKRIDKSTDNDFIKSRQENTLTKSGLMDSSIELIEKTLTYDFINR